MNFANSATIACRMIVVELMEALGLVARKLGIRRLPEESWYFTARPAS
jgi:hypothetical protein